MMKKLLGVNLAVLMVILIGGCNDAEKRRVDELTLHKHDLEGELQRLKGELDLKHADLARCQDRLASLTGERGQLIHQLEALRNQPQMPDGWEIRKGMAMTSLSDAVLFDPGQAKLKSSATATLQKVIREIKANFPGQDVYIIGHTDSDPIRRSKWSDNLELSLQRSAAVARFMISNGMDSKQVVVSGTGEYRPVVPNRDAASKAKNRRVEFWILKPMQ